jgi:hypothetical protein
MEKRSLSHSLSLANWSFYDPAHPQAEIEMNGVKNRIEAVAVTQPAPTVIARLAFLRILSGRRPVARLSGLIKRKQLQFLTVWSDAAEVCIKWGHEQGAQ